MTELAVTVGLVGVLLAVAVPELGHWTNRSAVNNAAESLQNGIRLAQAEAVRRNTPVNFVLIGTDAATATAATPQASGTSTWRAWVVRGMQNNAMTIFHAGEVARDAPYATLKAESNAALTLTFNGFGRVVDGNGTALAGPLAYDVRNVDAKVKRARCVYVTPVGAVKMCDPAAASGAPTACTGVTTSQCPIL